jgi:O-methyltransferase involved in polyketide biosynthesis
MSEKTTSILGGVPETLLITLYVRAMESQRPDALLKDEKAVELVSRLSYDFERIRQIPMDEADRTSLILRNREFDTYVKGFLARHPQTVVVHIGCGLDSRFERVDDGRVAWYDLDVPEVIALRRELLGGESGRCHLLACSAFDPAWFETVGAHKGRDFLFVAEGVFMYFEEAQIRSLVLGLREHFPNAELVFDTFSPLHVFMSNLRLSITKFGARYHWGLRSGRELEDWAAGIRLLDRWGIFDRDEPRLAQYHWMRNVPLFSGIMRIFHYQLGMS